MRRRIKNLITRMLNGDDFFTSGASPRISLAEIKELEELGIQMQTESMHGAELGYRVAYPLHREEFAKKAKKLLEEDE